MTMLGDSPMEQPQTETDPSQMLAVSVGTVGYAMFAWLQQGTLSEIKPMPVVVDAIMQMVQAEEAQRAAEIAQMQARAAAVHGVGQVDGFVEFPHGAPTPDEVQGGAAAPQRFMPDEQYTPPAPAAEVPPLYNPEQHAGVPAVGEQGEPLPPKEYTGNQTLQMLQEISFLDE